MAILKNRVGAVAGALTVSAAGALVLLAGSAALGQASTVAVAQPGEENKPISILVGQSQILRPPWPVARVSVTDPTIADVDALTPEQVLVMGKKPGATDLVMWSKDEKVWRARLDVGIDVARVRADLAAMFPGAELDVASVQNVLVISGQMRRVEDSATLRAFLEKSAVPFIDKTGVAGVQQVNIHVRVAEVSRSATRQLGFNAYWAGTSFFGGVQPGPVNGGALNSGFNISPGDFSSNVNPAVTIFGGVPAADFNFFIQALQENQYLRLLAEPSLKCISGEEASFLAGGEFPIPVVQNSGGGTGSSGTSAITIVYREFGVRLKFKPQVLGDNTIRLQVAPEVSELSDVGAVTLQGFRIPGLLTRKAETTLELKSGQTFALAGLLSQRADGRNSRIPGLGDVPVIGALFRSIRYNAGETEMVVMVTADLVEPLNESGRSAVPGSLDTPPNDWELYTRGKLDGDMPAKVSPADAAWLEEKGLDRLRGPGAWMEYEQKAAGGRSSLRPGPGSPGR